MPKEIVIFLIEDDFLFSKIVAAIVEKAAAELHQEDIQVRYEAFYSSREAKYELSQNPSIVLLDYYIMDDDLEPETGLPFLKTVKNFNPEIDIIVVSGQVDPEVVQQVLREGASHYVSKNTDLNSTLYPILLETIRKHANK